MEFLFPKYPFVWNYDSMYDQIDFTSKILTDEILLVKSELNMDPESYLTIGLLLDKFPNYQIIKTIQNISANNICNINIHTWYLSQLNIFDCDESNIKIITNSKFKYKSDVNVFIFDPFDIFYKPEYDRKSQNIAIIKNYNSIITNLIPKIRIHIHNVDGVLRFSPNNNNIIKIKETVENPIYYIIVDKLIVYCQIKIN